MSVEAPVPPFAIARVPPRVSVPESVIGPPESVKPVVPPEPETEVTEPSPEPKPRLEVATQEVALPVVCSTKPFVPDAFEESNSAPVMYALPSTVSGWDGVLVPIPKLVPSNIKLALSVNAVPPALVKRIRLAAKED